MSDKPVRGSININIAANGNHGSVRFKENSQSGRKVIGICSVLKRHNILKVNRGQSWVTMEWVREGNIFIQGEGVGSNRTGDVDDN